MIFIIHPCDPTVVICYLIWPCDIAVRITYPISHSPSLSYNTVIKGYSGVQLYNNLFFIKDYLSDDAFLLRFLRNAKFSQLKAQEKIDNFWTVRSVEERGAKWFKDLDPQKAELSEILERG